MQQYKLGLAMHGQPTRVCLDDKSIPIVSWSMTYMLGYNSWSEVLDSSVGLGGTLCLVTLG